MIPAAASAASRPAGGFALSNAGNKPQTSSSGNGGAAGDSNNNNKKKKKMVIRPFKVQPKLPENFEETTWETLRRAVVAVQSKEAMAISHEELYRAVEDMCVHKMGGRLYDHLKEECMRHVAGAVGALAATGGGMGGMVDQALFLERVDDVWQDHCEHMLTIRSIFLYLDRSYVMQVQGLQPIWEMGLTLFRLQLAAQGRAAGSVAAAAAAATAGGRATGGGGLEIKIIKGLLVLIERQRNGESVNQALLRSLVKMLGSLGLYKPLFLKAFLEDTERYFAAEGVKKMESLDVVAFLVHVERRLAEAGEACVAYLEGGTKKALVSAIEARLLAPHVTTLIEKGFGSLMDAQRVEDLRRMYLLCCRKVGGEGEVKSAFNAYIRRRGAELVSDEAREKEMVEDLLEFKGKCDIVLMSALGGKANVGCVNALKDGFEFAVNVRPTRPAELLAKFIDVKLKGEKGVSEVEVEGLLDKAMVLFRFVGSKDVFEAFYKKDLAKRLLLGKSASADLEKSMIAKLKAECGATFTNKLEGMFKDMDLSRELMGNYTQYCEASGERGREGGREVETSVHVLTTGYWPAFPLSEVVVPMVLEPYMRRFSEYYTGKYQGRRLMWQHALGTCVVKARFLAGTKELSVSFFQMLVLLCFNDGRERGVSFAEIKAATRVEDGELRRTLQSLACGKVNQRVLHKEPKGKEVEDSDAFSLNLKFEHKLYRIKINTIQLKETVEENEKTHADVHRDRQYQIDAAIVRIMKARKKLSHNLLLSELFGQLKFPATPVDIKKRVESLIERDYLCRDDTNPSIYNYVA
ncbi:ubiquitin-protein cullin 4 [Nannochloropsis oceanica]